MLELTCTWAAEETSAHVERKEKEVIIMQRRLQELQTQFTETQKLGLKKDKVKRGGSLDWNRQMAGARLGLGGSRLCGSAILGVAWRAPT